MTTIARPRTSFVAQLIVAIRDQIRALSARRLQRIALNDLLVMDAARLNDLGLNRHDIIEAMNAARTAPTDLEARREFNVTRQFALGAN